MEMVPVHATLPQFEDYKYIEQHRTPHDAKKKQHWLKHREIAWDNTSRKYTPMMLRGWAHYARAGPTTASASARSARSASTCVVATAPDPTSNLYVSHPDGILFPLLRATAVGSGKASWEKEVPEVQTMLFDQTMSYHDWRIKHNRLKSVLQTSDEYRILRC